MTFSQLDSQLSDMYKRYSENYDTAGWNTAAANYIAQYGGDSAAQLAAKWGITLGGDTPTKPPNTPTGTGGGLVNVPGYGNLSTTEALRLAESGVISPYYDSNGNLAFALSKGNTKTVNTTR